jgi:hypothetical protein
VQPRLPLFSQIQQYTAAVVLVLFTVQPMTPQFMLWPVAVVAEKGNGTVVYFGPMAVMAAAPRVAQAVVQLPTAAKAAHNRLVVPVAQVPGATVFLALLEMAAAALAILIQQTVELVGAQVVMVGTMQEMELPVGAVGVTMAVGAAVLSQPAVQEAADLVT